MNRQIKNRIGCFFGYHDWRNFALPYGRYAMDNLFRKYLWCPCCHKAFAISPYEDIDSGYWLRNKNGKNVFVPDLIPIKDREQFFNTVVLFELL